MNSFYCILAVIIAATCIRAQQLCPSITVTQTLASSYESSPGVTVYMYDLIIVNEYTEQVSNIVFAAQSTNTAATSAITTSWNLQLLADTSAGEYSFTIVEAAATHSLSLAAGATYYSAGYSVSGTPTQIQNTVTCTRSVSATTSASATTTATTSSVAVTPSSTTGAGSAAPVIAECTELSVSVQSVGSTWRDSTNEYQQYSVTVVNTGSKAATSALTTVYYATDYGYVSQMWNMVAAERTASDDGGEGSAFEMQLYNLAPGQTFTGAGFIFAESLVHITEGHQGHYDFPYDADARSIVC